MCTIQIVALIVSWSWQFSGVIFLTQGVAELQRNPFFGGSEAVQPCDGRDNQNLFAIVVDALNARECHVKSL